MTYALAVQASLDSMSPYLYLYSPPPPFISLAIPSIPLSKEKKKEEKQNRKKERKMKERRKKKANNTTLVKKKNYMISRGIK